MFKAATSTSDCLKAFPTESTSTDTPFRTRHGVPTFTYYAQNPGPAARFAKAMSGMTRSQFAKILLYNNPKAHVMTLRVANRGCDQQRIVNLVSSKTSSDGTKFRELW